MRATQELLLRTRMHLLGFNRQWLVWEVILTAMLFIQKAFHHRVGFGNPESLQVWGSVQDSVSVCSSAVPDEIWFQRKPLDMSSLWATPGRWGLALGGPVLFLNPGIHTRQDGSVLITKLFLCAMVSDATNYETCSSSSTCVRTNVAPFRPGLRTLQSVQKQPCCISAFMNAPQLQSLNWFLVIAVIKISHADVFLKKGK